MTWNIGELPESVATIDDLLRVKSLIRRQTAPGQPR